MDGPCIFKDDIGNTLMPKMLEVKQQPSMCLQHTAMKKRNCTSLQYCRML